MKKDNPRIVRGNDFNLIVTIKERTGFDENGEPVFVPFDISKATSVMVSVKREPRSYFFPFDMDGDTLTIHIDGTKLPNGNYGVEIVADKDGNRRSFKRCQFAIVESDDEAGLVGTPEFGVRIIELDTQVIIGSSSGGGTDLSDYYTKDEIDKELKGKVSVEAGKKLSSNDYTDEDKAKLESLTNYNDSLLKEQITKLQEDFANVTGAVISTSEQKVSVFRYGGKDYDVYELTVELSDLPVVAGESVDITVSDQPCGNNLYLTAHCLSIATGTGEKSVFPVSAYSVKKVYVDDDMNTVATIVCNENVTEVTKAILTIRYVKGLLSFDNIELSIPVSELGITSADEVAVEIPPLKYNKKMCYQFSMDDGIAGVYHVHWKHIREKKLCFTNGCGIDKLFAPAHAWVTYNAYMIDLHTKTDETAKYCSWIFANKMLDFGSSIYNHGGGRYGCSFIEHPETALTYENAKKSYNDNARAIEDNAGIFPYIAVTPGGDSAYMQPYDEVEKQDTRRIYAHTSKTGTSNPETIESIINLMNVHNSRLIFSRRNLDTFHDSDNLDGIVTKIEEAYNSNNRFVYSDFAHGPGYSSPESNQQTARNHMTWLYDNYGKGGNDSIWFCPMDEFFEYQLSRMLGIIKTDVTDGNLNIKIKYPKFPHFRFFDSSIVIKNNTGNINNAATVTTSENIVGLSYNKQSDGGLMVCFNWNNGERSLLNLAEKYTGIYESELTEDSKWDAMYFVDQLKSDLQIPFINRLNAGEVAPVLNSISINAGAASTYDRNINIILNVTGTITHYKIAENADLSVLAWIEGTGKNLDFILSDGFGNKTVYVQCKNDFGKSEITSATVNYTECPAVTYTVAGKSNNTSYGTVTPASQTVAEGGNATVNAQANDGYIIESWKGADTSTGVGEVNGTASVKNVTADKTIECNFKKNEVTPPAGKNKWILSFGWSFDDAVFDSASGISKQMGVTAKKDLYTNNGAKLAKMKAVEYGSMVTYASLTKNPDNRGAITGDNSGIYPDIYLAQIKYPYQANEDGVQKYGYQFFELPNGVYRIKILVSTIRKGFNGTGELGYNVNGVEKRVDAGFPLNNLTEFIVFDNIQVNDGIIDLSFYNVSETAKCPMVSIVEIEEL